MTNGRSSWARLKTTPFGPIMVSKSSNPAIYSIIRANIRDRRSYFLKFETFIPHKDHPDVDVSERGSTGPVKSVFSLLCLTSLSNIRSSAGHFAYNSYITQQFIRACGTAGIPVSPDVNTSKGTLGATKVTATPYPSLLKA